MFPEEPIPGLVFDVDDLEPEDKSELLASLAERQRWLKLFGKNFPQSPAASGYSPKGKPFRYYREIESSGNVTELRGGDIFVADRLQINTPLISAIVVDTQHSEEVPELEPPPNISVPFDEGSEIFYFLSHYVRQDANTKKFNYLKSIVRRVELAVRGKHIGQNACRNPFQIFNNAVLLSERRYTFGDLKPIINKKRHADRETAEAERQAAAEQARKEAGIRSAMLRRSKSNNAICAAIEELVTLSQQPTQARVQEITRLGLRTIKRHWHDEPVQELLTIWNSRID